MTTDAKIIPLTDEEGFKLPKNMSKQFRDVQSGIEYLKMSADDVVVELKGVNHKLANNTTDLKEITAKVNEIDKRITVLDKKVVHLAKVSQKNFESVGTALTGLTDLLKSIAKITTSVSNEAKPAEAVNSKTKPKKKR